MSRRRKATAWRTGHTHITAVAGPPCGGKTTYVQEHAAPDDLVIDFDHIAQRLGSTSTHDHTPEAITAAKAEWIRQVRDLEQGNTTQDRAWIVSASSKAETRIPHHELVMCDPGQPEAQRRATQAGRPDEWPELITQWYADRQQQKQW